jgi:hypothetical protein
MASLSFFGATYWVKSWDRGIVLIPRPIKEGPSVIFSSNQELPVGIMVVTKREGDWLKVIYPTRFEGWIHSTHIKELK